MYKINFVCTGNICRSQMAHSMFQNYINENDDPKNWFIDSCGTTAWEEGNTMYRPARKTLALHNIPVVESPARKITQRDIDEFDLILVMTKGHLTEVRNTLKNTENKVYMYNQITSNGILEDSSSLDILDPWYGPDEGFKDTYNDINDNLETVMKFCKGLKTS